VTGSGQSLWSRPLPTPGDVSIRGYLRDLQPAERRALAISVAVTLLVPVVLGLTLPPLAGLLLTTVWFAIYFVMPAVLVTGLVYRWAIGEEGLFRGLVRLLRPAVMMTGTDLSFRGVPWATLGLIALNVIVFLRVADPGIYSTDSGDLLRVTGIVPLFMHADADHLFGNMLFLWVFGSSLEPRMNSLRFLGAYLGLGIAADLVDAFAHEVIMGRSGGGIGASGAIAGVMGVFMVRCYFAGVSMIVPIFPFAAVAGLSLPVGLSVRVHAVLILIMYCMLDLAGAVSQAAGDASGIGYWAHVGGFYAGLALAYPMGMLGEGLRERMLSRALANEPEGLDDRLESLDTFLEIEDSHAEALLARARRLSRFELTEQAATDYVRAIRVLLSEEKKGDDAAKAFAEYHRHYGRAFEPAEQLRLTRSLILIGEIHIAARGLEMILEHPSITEPQQHQALFRLGRLLEEMGLVEPAVRAYQRLLETGHSDDIAPVVRSRLANLA
jgi:membrane associated rhomboid family serine protease